MDGCEMVYCSCTLPRKGTVAALSPGDYVRLRRTYKDWWGRTIHEGTRGFIRTIKPDEAYVHFSKNRGMSVLKKDLVLLVKGENG